MPLFEADLMLTLTPSLHGFDATEEQRFPMVTMTASSPTLRGRTFACRSNGLIFIGEPIAPLLCDRERMGGAVALIRVASSGSSEILTILNGGSHMAGSATLTKFMANGRHQQREKFAELGTQNENHTIFCGVGFRRLFFLNTWPIFSGGTQFVHRNDSMVASVACGVDRYSSEKKWKRVVRIFDSVSARNASLEARSRRLESHSDRLETQFASLEAHFCGCKPLICARRD
jgi:hypothetical protein